MCGTKNSVNIVLQCEEGGNPQGIQLALNKKDFPVCKVECQTFLTDFSQSLN